MSELIGQQLGQYQIVALLGQGGMATVYRAYQPSIKRFVAIKVMDPRLSREGDFLQRFALEAQTIAGLSHAHILKVFDFGLQDNHAYLVMELLRGGTLARILQRGPIVPGKALQVVEQVASALDYAHGRGIIHRDLKPQNLMLDDSGNILLADFGMVKLVNEMSGLTQTGLTMGTPAYMSPEQWRGENIDHRLDVYALGVILFEMLTGKTPFIGDTAYRVMYMHLFDPIPALTQQRPDVPVELDQVIERALAKDPQARFASTGALALGMRRALQGQPAAQYVAPRATSRTGPLPNSAVDGANTIKLPTVQPIKRVTVNPGTLRTDPKGVAQVWVPAGCFEMGSDPDKVARPDETPRHEVCLSQGFWLDQYPVTNAAYQEFINDDSYAQRQYWSNSGWHWLTNNGIKGPGNYPYFVDPQQPRVGISWFEADAYARWRGGRLPTEAEWEYAARGPESRKYPWGNEYIAGRANVNNNRTTPVGSFADSASWTNAYDLAGNAWEWTNDWYDESYYREDVKNDPPGPASGKTKTMRGGSWHQKEAFVRATARRHDAPITRDNYIGFRIVTVGK